MLVLAVPVQLELTRPWWLLGLAVVPGLVYYFYRSLVDFARWQRVLSLLLRGALVVLLILALGGLSLVRPTRELFVVFAVDRSESVGEQANTGRRRLPDEAAPHAGTNRFAVLPFASEPGSVRDGAEAVKATREARRRGIPKRGVAIAPPGPRRSRPTPGGSIARGPTWPRRWRWRRRRSRRSTSRGSCCSPTAIRPPATPSRPPRRCRARSRC